MDVNRPALPVEPAVRPRHARPPARVPESVRHQTIETAEEAVAAKRPTTRLALFEGVNNVLGEGAESRVHRALIQVEERGQSKQIPVVALVPVDPTLDNQADQERRARRLDGVNRVHRSLEQAFKEAREGRYRTQQEPTNANWTDRLRDRVAQATSWFSGQRRTSVGGVEPLNHTVDAAFHQQMADKMEFRIMRTLGAHQVERIGADKDGNPERKGTTTAVLVEAMPGTTFHDAMRDGKATQRDIVHAHAFLANYSREMNRAGYHESDIKPMNLMFEARQPTPSGEQERLPVLSKIDHGVISSHAQLRAKNGEFGGTLGYCNGKPYWPASQAKTHQEMVVHLDAASSHLVAANLLRSITGSPPLEKQLEAAEQEGNHEKVRVAWEASYAQEIQVAEIKVRREAGPEAAAMVKDILTKNLSRDQEQVYPLRKLSAKLIELGALMPDKPMPYDNGIGFINEG
jgi:hypothetical protein